MNDLTPIALMALKYCEMIVTSIDITHAVMVSLIIGTMTYIHTSYDSYRLILITCMARL